MEMALTLASDRKGRDMARTSIGALLALAAGALLSAAAFAADAPPTLKAPFDVAGQRAAWGRIVLPLERCAEPPAAPRDLVRGDFYTDKSHSQADPGKRRAALDTLAPLWAFTKSVSEMADDYAGARQPDDARAACAVRWLDAWASAGALTGEISTWARYDTLWAAEIAAGLAYLKVRDAAGIDSGARRRIEAWIERLARAAVADNDKFNAYRDERRLPPHNFAYWTAAGAMVAAVAAGKRDLYDWGVKQARRGLASVGATGAMPGEMERKGRAFVYHVWALEPLMLAVAIAHANGDDLTKENGGALSRLVGFMLAAHRDPAAFEKIAGVPQQADSKPERWPRKDNAASLEIYLSLRPDAEIERLLKPLRPVTSQFLGGNVTLMFGKR
jgi:poly(beta-D-mannuronate) lyase